MPSPAKSAVLHARVSYGQGGIGGSSIFELNPADLNQKYYEDKNSHGLTLKMIYNEYS